MRTGRTRTAVSIAFDDVAHMHAGSRSKSRILTAFGVAITLALVFRSPVRGGLVFPPSPPPPPLPLPLPRTHLLTHEAHASPSPCDPRRVKDHRL
jgi:hypothetical protein